MYIKQTINNTLFVFTTLLLVACDNNGQGTAGNTHDDAHGEALEEAYVKGPHGGRLLTQDGFALEVTIFERDTPPEFRLYPTQDDEAIASDQVDVTITLQRTGNKIDTIRFDAQQDHLRGDMTIDEPHSFDVIVKASYKGKQYDWQYESYEGRTVIPDDVAKQQGIISEIAGPITLAETRSFTGRVQADPNRLSHVRPRFPGVVVKVRKDLGDKVRAGDLLATIQSNESLQNYQLKAPIDGVIVNRDIRIGESTGEAPLFIIADLSVVWVKLDVFVSDLASVKKGQAVSLQTLDEMIEKSAQIDWVSPLASQASQSVSARIIVDNEDASLRPGQFIRGHVTVAENAIPLAVKQSAIQRFRDFDVVFARFDDTYEVRMLTLGRSNDDWVEVIAGLDAGTEYVSGNSYLIKADIEKSGASHDH